METLDDLKQIALVALWFFSGVLFLMSMFWLADIVWPPTDKEDEK